MKRNLFLMAVVAVLVMTGLGGNNAFTQTAIDPGIDQVITKQQNRIDEGIKSKKLSSEEAKTLQDNLTRIREEGARLKADGKLTKEEKAQLNKMLEQNSKMIQDKKQTPVKAVSGGSAAATPATAPAQVPTKPVPVTPAVQDTEIKEKIASQQKKIDEGIKSQQLTLQEAKVLENNLKEIREEETGARADGTFTKEDKAEILELLGDNEKMIKDKKNNPVKDVMAHRELKEREYSVSERIGYQQKRINRGLDLKKLSKEESKTLLDNLQFIRQDEARLKTDNKLTSQEKDRLHALLDQNSKMIRKEKDSPVKKVN